MLILATTTTTFQKLFSKQKYIENMIFRNISFIMSLLFFSSYEYMDSTWFQGLRTFENSNMTAHWPTAMEKQRESSSMAMRLYATWDVDRATPSTVPRWASLDAEKPEISLNSENRRSVLWKCLNWRENTRNDRKAGDLICTSIVLLISWTLTEYCHLFLLTTSWSP